MSNDQPDDAQAHADARATALRAGTGLASGPPDLHELCELACHDLALQGVALNLMVGDEPAGVVASAGGRSRAWAELQFTVGEGPCRDAYAEHRPVLIPDLRVDGTGRWTGYRSAALGAGLAAVFAFPVHVAAVTLGVLELQRDAPGELGSHQLDLALAYAELATTGLLDGQLVHDQGELDHEAADALHHRAEIYQAQGMLMVVLDVDPGEALARMRAHAFGHDRSLLSLAKEIVAGRTFSVDDI